MKKCNFSEPIECECIEMQTQNYTCFGCGATAMKVEIRTKIMLLPKLRSQSKSGKIDWLIGLNDILNEIESCEVK